MPGYFIHLASCHKKARENKTFRLGVETPDLLKTYYRLGPQIAKIKYTNLKTDLMPDFDVFLKNLNQKERENKNEGMHFGISGNPHVLYFWQNLTTEQQNNPFYRGYLWHLLTDLLIYTYLDWNYKLNQYVKQNLGSWEEAINLLHIDWDKTNKKIQDLYPDIVIPPEIQELNIINYLDSSNLTFINLNMIIELINFLANFNPLEEDINNIIALILQKVEEGRDIVILNRTRY